jgi:transcriptional regulator
MYILPEFHEKDWSKLIDFISRNPFATLIGANGQTPVATQIPLMLDEKEGKYFLKGHFMRNTDHHLAFEKNNQALVLFHGPSGYVSASWYDKKNVGSTWNYVTVHARGELSFLPEEELIKEIEKLTGHFEGKNSPASFSELTEDYIQKMVKAIVGFSIGIKELDGIYKLSQNHPETNRESIMMHLQHRGAYADAELVKYMRKEKSTKQK